MLRDADPKNFADIYLVCGRTDVSQQIIIPTYCNFTAD